MSSGKDTIDASEVFVICFVFSFSNLFVPSARNSSLSLSLYVSLYLYLWLYLDRYFHLYLYHFLYLCLYLFLFLYLSACLSVFGGLKPQYNSNAWYAVLIHPNSV